MPGRLLEMDSEADVLPTPPEYGFVVSHQVVELDIDFSTLTVTGRCELTILPQSKDLRALRIDARQCDISGGVMVNGRLAEFEYEDPMEGMAMREHVKWGVQQYEQQRLRIAPLVEDQRSKGALVVHFPKMVKVEEVDPFSESAASAVAQRAVGSVSRAPSIALDGLASTPVLATKTAVEQAGRYLPLTVTVPFETKTWREGLHFVGLGEGDARFPHVYTRHSLDPGIACCIFPCIDDPQMRCTWNISIKCSRTLGEALKRKPTPKNHGSLQHLLQKKGLEPTASQTAAEEQEVPLSDEEKLLEMTVVCSGEQMNETTDLEDSSKKVVTFSVNTNVAPRHIGFAIGPFEHVDLSEYREVEDDEKLGQGQTVPVTGYCLPGRADELRNTCTPMAHALDYFLLTFGSYPFSECKFVFVNDVIRDTEHTASLTLCSSRLLFSEDIIDPELDTIRTLVHGIASQYIGVNVIPEHNTDRWVTVGLSNFMAGLFMKTLCGDNEYSYRQKILMDKLVDEDIGRPSLNALGECLGVGKYEHDFMTLKAPLVIFILDKRIIKASGATGLTRVISKMIVNANTGSVEESVTSTHTFRKHIDKITKYRHTETFLNQWVFGGGCPRFTIGQKFNKKRLVVELTIVQKQVENLAAVPQKLTKDVFMREIQEEVHGIFAADPQPVFTGPMTIRIHEADGTPYEHIVEIREGSAKIEIPYNTKYKRLKRTRRQRERLNAGPADVSGEAGEDALIYCLGDVLQSREEVIDWGLHDWSKEQETKMEQESFEWIRVDADFEWLCQKTFINIEAYMYVSELQQDRDIVAQHDAMQFLGGCGPHPLVASFLVRTLVDKRYFHAIRTMAAEFLDKHASKATSMIGLKFLQRVYYECFCYQGSKMPSGNDFTDKRAYQVEKAIATALSRIRVREPGLKGLVCPKEARHLLLDMLRFNDNTNNEYSDNFKVANLLSALANSLVPTEDASNVLDEEKSNGVPNGVNVDGEGSINGQDPHALAMDFELEPVIDLEPEEFKRTVIEELDRYCRMDEWINSYHNIYTTTVLSCKQRLMKAKVIPSDPIQFAQYLHDGTADDVRIQAFESLVELGYMKHDSVLTLLLNTLSTDPSPYTRSKLFEIFMLGLADIAFGDPKLAELSAVAPRPDGNTHTNGDMLLDPASQDQGGLIVETDVSTDARKDAKARIATVLGAIAALKRDAKDEKALQDALWRAIGSDLIGAREQSDLLDLCSMIYEPVYSTLVKLKLPRYKKVTNHGKGVISFKDTNKIRIKPRNPWKNPEPPKPVLAPIKAPLPTPAARPVISIPATSQPQRVLLKTTPTTTTTIKLNKTPLPSSPPPALPAAPPANNVTLKQPVKAASSAMKPPKRPSPSTDDNTRPSKIIKLRLDPLDLRRLKAGTAKSSPAPQAKIKSSTASPAPAIVPSSTITASPSPAPARRPLPDSGSGSGRKLLPETRTPLPTSTSIEVSMPTPTGRKPLPGAGARKPLPDTPPVPAPARVSTPVQQTSVEAPQKKLMIKLKLAPGKHLYPPVLASPAAASTTTTTPAVASPAAASPAATTPRPKSRSKTPK